MTTHRDLTTPEEVLAALRAGESVEVNTGGPWVKSELTTSSYKSNVADALRAGLRYRARPADPIPRTFTAAEVAEACEKVAQEWRDECDRLNGGRHRPFTSEENSVRALAFAGCADELHERITHWLRENEG
jgi:NAD(P)-dependent dehydrogenase (short-subunit alcohol dehydrogenase family)